VFRACRALLWRRYVENLTLFYRCFLVPQVQEAVMRCKQIPRQRDLFDNPAEDLPRPDTLPEVNRAEALQGLARLLSELVLAERPTAKREGGDEQDHR
jgi:hypothetical protein